VTARILISLEKMPVLRQMASRCARKFHRDAENSHWFAYSGFILWWLDVRCRHQACKFCSPAPRANWGGPAGGDL